MILSRFRASALARTTRSTVRRIGAASLGLLVLTTGGVAAADTHLGQQPSEHVILNFWNFAPEKGFCPVGDESGQTLYFERIMPDGTAVPFPSVPKGKRLIVTDWNLKTYVGDPFPRTATVNAHLRLINQGASPVGGFIVADQDFHLVEDHKSLNMTMEGQSLAGISVGPEAHLCPVIILDAGSGPGERERLKSLSGNYRGYLIDEEAPTDPPTDDPRDDETGLFRAPTDTSGTITSNRDLYTTLR